VRNVVTVGIFSGRGSLRDQFGRDNAILLTHSRLPGRFRSAYPMLTQIT
jgi:hypothetical protein